jgi:hypothetical protein
MAGAFDDIRLKLQRAYDHSKEYRDKARAFWESPFYKAAWRRDAKGRFVFQITHVKAMPPALSVLIGEAAQQIRSSLDHVMYRLAKPQKHEEHRVQFPVVDHYAEWKDTLRRMPGVARGVRSRIEQLQPYHKRRRPEVALLGLVRDISNWDKHRSLLAATPSIKDTNPQPTIIGGAMIHRVENFTPVLAVGAMLTRVELVQPAPPSQLAVKHVLTLQPVFDVGMRKSFRGLPIISTLQQAGEFVENEVLPLLERFAK